PDPDPDPGPGPGPARNPARRASRGRRLAGPARGPAVGGGGSRHMEPRGGGESVAVRPAARHPARRSGRPWRILPPARGRLRLQGKRGCVLRRPATGRTGLHRGGAVTAACILGLEGQALTAAERAFFADLDPWGFILFR